MGGAFCCDNRPFQPQWESRSPLIGKGDIDAEGAAGIDAHFGTGGHIERTLPKAIEVVEGVLQSLCGEMGSTETENRHFLSDFDGEGDLITTRVERAEIAYHPNAGRRT